MIYKTFRLDKLVRDGIVEGHQDEGCEGDYEILDDDTRFGDELNRKLAEEKLEYEAAQSDEDKAKERRDINDVLFALGEPTLVGYVPTNTFNNREYIRTVTVPETSWLYPYYLKDPERFPEVVL